MDISIIISSFNQRRRLKFCLESLVNQIAKDFEYEIILADDNSTDGTLEYVSENFPSVKISVNIRSKSGIYTLADNWNYAAKKAKGKRLVFSNADMVFCKDFLHHHLDPNMQDSIIFGPGYDTDPSIDDKLQSFNNVKEVITWIDSNSLIRGDRREDKSTNTYNLEWGWWYPFGYNFSVIKDEFDGVGGFPSYQRWGGEETELCRKIVEKYGTKVKSNKFTYSIHLWHPRVNEAHIDSRKDDIRF